MQADFAEVGTADFSEICLLVSVADEAPAKPMRSSGVLRTLTRTHLRVSRFPYSIEPSATRNDQL